METTALGFLYGPTLVLIAVTVLLAVGRLTSSSHIRRRRLREGTDADYGLLVPVATVPADRAEQVRATLAAYGVRSTRAPAPPSPALMSTGEALLFVRARCHVLVFADDLPRATRVLARARRRAEDGA